MSDMNIRHSIMRKLQRADWADQEGDPDDAFKSVLAASRLARKLDHQPDKLPSVLGRALTAVLEQYDAEETIQDILAVASPILTPAGEPVRSCDYGM